jgi:hypothetical protein
MEQLNQQSLYQNDGKDRDGGIRPGRSIWVKAATAGKDARNVTYKKRIGMDTYQAMFGEKRDVSDFRAFWCRAWAYLDKQR